jgi:flavin-dependent dehydrogenase
MATQLPTAIVGGGPAGALAGERLARGKRDVVLFDEKLAWEKPCGGGITHKALTEYPFLAEACHNPVTHCELISPAGLRVRIHLRYPVAIFSRFALNELLLERAQAAGVELRKARVTRISHEDGSWRLITLTGEYRASYLILAAGARNPFHVHAQFLCPLSSNDLQVTAGYFIPRHSSVMQIQFLKGITGYIWVFPRLDHVSAGITGKMGESSTADLRRMLERWLEENKFSPAGAHFYSHILPALRSRTLETLRVCGEDWAAVGDSAGLVDPITGEGLYYALRSADLCAQAVLVGRPEEYQTRLEKEILPELRLAARVSQRFYNGQVFGESVLERMVSLTSQSENFRDLMSDLFAGIQGYRDLRSRLYRSLPALMAEGLSGALRLPWSGSGLTTDSFAK